MSASTAPAATPDPNSAPANTSGAAPQATPAQGLLASMLTPVAPARTAAFTLAQEPADSTPATGAALPAEGLSSAEFRDEDDAQQDTKTTGNSGGSGKQQGIWRAWMLAGAARWARGGGTQNKRLDMKKARAQANQVKEARQVVVNKSGGLGGGTASGGRSSNASGAGGGKGLGGKAPKGDTSPSSGSTKGPKNSSGSSGPGANRGPAGRDNNRSADRAGSNGPKSGSGGSGEGRGTSGGTSPGKKGNNTAPKNSADTPSRTPKPHSSNDTRTPKPPKGNSTSSSSPKGSTGGTSGGGKNGAPGAAGAPGKSGAGSADGKTPKPEKQTTPAKEQEPQTGKDTPSSKPADGAKEKASTAKTAPKQEDKDSKGKPAASDISTDASASAKTDSKDTKAGAAPISPDKAGSEKKPSDPVAENTGKPFTTRPARETGYRDGTRAARGAAHVKAYRDGVKDGWVDTTEAANREKARLDKVHTDRKNARKDQHMGFGKAVEYNQGTGFNPITADGSNGVRLYIDGSFANGSGVGPTVDTVTSTHLDLGAGAARSTITRGEVRSLKGFERRLEERVAALTKRAEQTRGLKAHADQQAQKATRLLEAARGVKGGNKLIGTLTKLQDAAQAQAGKADEIHKQSVRAAEQCRTALSNVKTRYGAMYQAVVDSPETSPAELAFYKG